MISQPDLFQRPPQEVLEEKHLRNQKLLSSYYLAYRLPERTLWMEIEDRARTAMDQAKGALERAEELGVLEARNEADTEAVFIRPVLEALGWRYIAQPSLVRYEAKRKPDYALYVDESSHRVAGNNREDMALFYGKAAAIAEAKYWGRPMNDWDDTDPHDKSDATKQITSYLRDVTEWTDGRTNWAILTNGKLWRLFQRRAGYTAENCLEMDLEEALRQGDLEAFKYFFILFGRDSFMVPKTETLPWVDSLVEESEDYSSGITEHLKELIFQSVFDTLARGFTRYRRHSLDIPVEAEDSACCTAIYQGCLTLLYRLLFLLNAESRGLLPLENSGYRKRSLRALMERAHELRGDDMDPDHDFACWEHLRSLFSLMDDGSPTFNLPRYNGGLFTRPDPTREVATLHDEEIGPWFLETHRLSDPYVCEVLGSLTFDPQQTGSTRAFIDYSSLGVRHLGEIYEGLLEFGVDFARDEAICLVGTVSEATWKAKSLLGEDDTVLEERVPGEPFVSNNKGERKRSGSYYTPHHIVEYIVARTVGVRLGQFQLDLERFRAIESAEGDGLQELFERRVHSTQADEAREQLWTFCRNDEERRAFLCSEMSDEWVKHRFDVASRALQLKTLDPAMGSGHFLVHVVDLISDSIATYLDREPNSPVAEHLTELRRGILRNIAEQRVAVDASKLTDVNLIKRMVMKRCVYGVDLNPMAVELAKLSLWLDSFTVGAPLSFLNHHLRCGNSLVGNTVRDVQAALTTSGGTMTSLWGSQFTGLMTAVEAMQKLSELADSTIAEVQESYSRFREASDALAPFKGLLDLWTSDSFGVGEAQQLLLSTPDTAEKVIAAALEAPANLEAKWQKAGAIVCGALFASRRERFFHWELEFPEVWYEKARERSNPGFDVVLGNPPYDVLSERESGQNLTALRRFLQANDIYKPSFHGKNNLYKLFICRATTLLSDAGLLGFITPMAILGDAQAVEVRRHLLGRGRFASVDAFPQKDNRRLRVFKDAKLPTAVFTYVLTAVEAEQRKAFVSRVHPENRIEQESPALELDATGIPLYDPSNLTIVSCSQEDWDLAIRITGREGIRRLGDFVEFFQGEVNETNERRRGNLLGGVTGGGQLVLRGASINLYVTRTASQGEDLFLNVKRFLSRKSASTKAFHHLDHRIGLQESSPQNNFRRIIAASISPGTFLNHKVNYVPAQSSALPLEFVLALLNTKMADWYFRLGSTNASVSHYQLYNLPCPVFATPDRASDTRMLLGFARGIRMHSHGDALAALQLGLQQRPFARAVCSAVALTARRLIRIEQRRGDVPRLERSRLCPEAQFLQDLIDKVFFRMAGLTAEEAAGLEARLGKML